LRITLLPHQNPLSSIRTEASISEDISQRGGVTAPDHIAPFLTGDERGGAYVTNDVTGA
jgi:hypothetical protein